MTTGLEKHIVNNIVNQPLPEEYKPDPAFSAADNEAVDRDSAEYKAFWDRLDGLKVMYLPRLTRLIAAAEAGHLNKGYCSPKTLDKFVHLLRSLRRLRGALMAGRGMMPRGRLRESAEAREEYLDQLTRSLKLCDKYLPQPTPRSQLKEAIAAQTARNNEYKVVICLWSPTPQPFDAVCSATTKVWVALRDSGVDAQAEVRKMNGAEFTRGRSDWGQWNGHFFSRENMDRASEFIFDVVDSLRDHYRLPNGDCLVGSLEVSLHERSLTVLFEPKEAAVMPTSAPPPAPAPEADAPAASVLAVA